MFFSTSGEKISQKEMIAPATVMSVLLSNPKQTGMQLEKPISLKEELGKNKNLSQEEINIILHKEIRSEEDLMTQIGMTRLPHQDAALNCY